MKIGDKVKHVNTGDHIYTIERIYDDKVATLKRPKELYTFINSRLIIKKYCCRIENLIIIP